MKICWTMSAKLQTQESVVVVEENKIKKVGEEFCKVTSAHGVSHLIYEKQTKLKLVWLIITIVGFSMNAFHVSMLVEQFLRYPSEEVSRVIYSTIEFPSVTVCNIQPFSLSERDKIDKNLTSKYRYWDQITDEYFKDLMTHYNITEESEQLFNRLKQPVGFYENIGDEVSILGHKKQDFIIGCTFGGHYCTAANFTHFIDPNFYNCFTFNGGGHNKQLKSRSTGPQEGLSMILYLESDNGQDDFEGIYHTFSTVGNAAGARIEIHYPNTRPNPTDNGFDVSPGFSTSVGIEVEKKHRLDEPYGPCYEHNFTETSKFVYSSLECLLQCKQRFILEKCGCVSIIDFIPPILPEIKENYCGYFNPDQEETFFRNVQCEYEYTEVFTTEADIMEQCNCEPPCHETFYSKSISFSYWPLDFVQKHFYELYVLNHSQGQNHKAYRNLSKYNWSDLVQTGMIRKNFARVNVYFSELAINEFTQTKTYELHNLWSDIGGTFGLWIGVSFITWCEFIQLVIRMVVLGVRKYMYPGNLEDQGHVQEMDGTDNPSSIL